MKIAIIHNQYSQAGGMEAYMLSLVKGFLADGDQVSIYAYEVNRELAAQSSCIIYQPSLLPLPGRWKKYHFLHLCNTRFKRESYDITLSLTRTSCQDIAVCGGVHPETIRRINRSSLFRWLHDKIEIYFEKKMFATVPLIMAHSKAISREIMAHYSVAEAKIKTIYPPIDTDKFFPADNKTIKATRKELQIDEKKITFLLPSCGHQCKGLTQLLAAFKILDPGKYELLVAGTKIPYAHPENCRYIGYIPNLAPVYSAVDFTILPSDYEAFGLVIPESLQCGTPVITTAEVGATELLSPRDGIILSDNRPETIARTIQGLSTTFAVTDNFAQTHGLTIGQHINTIKKLFGKS
ncbi:MAG: glycosyltransferase family 4 protein [Proteobacteria bacterium]|nr:glycosyltransferase family 4 protein [Pseudomonadota bacterium]MBU1060462.1 glycosyltransferase family 4 protein [Pseudomonadota bacterium]